MYLNPNPNPNEKMDTTQLETILAFYGKSSNFYYGVFAIDQLPIIDKFPSCLIINNKPSNHEGQHWVAIYFDKKRKCEFYDSFGKHPDYYGIYEYLKKYSTSIKYNNNKVQSNVSPYCGLYCIFFLIFKLKGKSMDFFKNLYEKNPMKNDKLFTDLIEEYF
jgi:hypothetical protein